VGYGWDECCIIMIQYIPFLFFSWLDLRVRSLFLLLVLLTSAIVESASGCHGMFVYLRYTVVLIRSAVCWREKDPWAVKEWSSQTAGVQICEP
jgi:hypothetical protein